MRSAPHSLKPRENGTATVWRERRARRPPRCGEMTFRLDKGLYSPMFFPCAGHGRASRSSETSGDQGMGRRDCPRGRKPWGPEGSDSLHVAPAARGGAKTGCFGTRGHHVPRDRPDRTLRSNPPIQQLLHSRPGRTTPTGRKVVRHYPPVPQVIGSQRRKALRPASHLGRDLSEAAKPRGLCGRECWS
jgi:hypothetical protein